MTTLRITRGLPASGKTTFATKWVARSPRTRARVNRDDLRDMLFGTRTGLSPEQEDTVTTASQTLVRAHLKSGLDVIVDDTHLRPKYIRPWQEIAQTSGAALEIQEFPVDVETAISRDSVREHSVGETVIHALADKYLPKGQFLPTPTTPPADQSLSQEYVPPESAPSAIIVDLDGTLAWMNDRGPFDWDRVGDDDPNNDVIDVVAALSKDVDHVVFMSGRDEVCRAATTGWLQAHLGGRVHATSSLHMRPAGDYRKDSVVKTELFDTHVRQKYRVVVVLDDRQQVVDMWRAMGLTCLQVAPGDF